ncbi:polysaccharide pyruvyl transferase family protein [Sphingobacterium gobiense]|uniref:Polysaccharide pyruvyl transferase domain-containing protein n=1 Tax=Sphingobacterium gobiense TaxID=1382456 RepID=A0A2S9JT78_9SPHI|nr:polysaccharide pyruvyl transferase family protein [Sphingobacterium gobiense]PRD56492.1 hypothetical protein C5749_04415 [Sphingobacterium gobiense]
MKKINLIYWNEANYGDALSPQLVKELTGIPVQYKDFTMTRNERLRTLLGLQPAKRKSLILPHHRIFGAVGSIMPWLPKGTRVWGSGLMNHHDQFRGGKVYAVRGKLTERKLVEQGIPACGVYGDPALLLPLWLEGAVQKDVKIGIIPHWKEVDFFKEKYGDRHTIIDFRTRDVVGTTYDITRCAYILSSSLHGLIVAHAYGIPALWIKHGYIDTDGFKFQDYFSSVDIPAYDGFTDFDAILNDESDWRQLFEVNPSLSGINNSLAALQKNLLAAAPFPLRDTYKKYTF